MSWRGRYWAQLRAMRSTHEALQLRIHICQVQLVICASRKWEWSCFVDKLQCFFCDCILHSCTIQLAIASRSLISAFVGTAPNQIWLILKQTQFWLSHCVSLPARHLTLRKPMSWSANIYASGVGNWYIANYVWYQSLLVPSPAQRKLSSVLHNQAFGAYIS